jgi:HK97 family phage prohead protease
MERKFYESQFKEADDEAMTIVGFISTEKPDRGNDIMRVNGMRIEGEISILFSHGMGPLGSEPIGRPLWIRKGEHGGYKGIQMKMEFFNDQVGQRLYRKVKEGYLHSFSIGYIVNEFTPIKGGQGRDITSWTLLEASLVAIPMQPDAQVIESGSFEGLQFKVYSDEEIKNLQLSEVLDMVKKRCHEEIEAYWWAMKKSILG